MNKVRHVHIYSKIYINPNPNNFLDIIKGKINSFISSIIEYSDDKNKKPLDDIKFPFIKKRNISTSKIKSQGTFKSWLRNYCPENGTYTFDYSYLPKRKNTFDKSNIIYKESNFPKNFLGKKTYRKTATFEIGESSKTDLNNIHKISTMNTSKEKIIKNYAEKIDPKYYKRNENKMHININYDNFKKYPEIKKYKKNNIVEKNDNDNDNKSINANTKKVFTSEKKISENKEIKNNNNISNYIENENENLNEKSDEIIIKEKEKEVDLNINDSFVSHRNNKYNSFISLNNSRVFTNELIQDNLQSFSLNLSEIKKNDNQKSNFIYQKQNEFSYKIPIDVIPETNPNKVKEEKLKQEIKPTPNNDILKNKETEKSNNKTSNQLNSINSENITNIFNKEKNDFSFNQNSLTNNTKDSSAFFKDNKNDSLFGKKKLNFFGGEKNSLINESKSLFNLGSQDFGVKKDKINNNEDKEDKEDKGGLFGNLKNSGNKISLFGNNQNSLFGSNDGNKVLFGVKNSNNNSLFG